MLPVLICCWLHCFMLPLETLSPCAYTYEPAGLPSSVVSTAARKNFLFSFPRHCLPACSSPQYASSMSMRTRPGVVFRAPKSLAWDCVWCPRQCCRTRTDDVPVSKPRINPCSDWPVNRRKITFARQLDFTIVCPPAFPTTINRQLCLNCATLHWL